MGEFIIGFVHDNSIASGVGGLLTLVYFKLKGQIDLIKKAQDGFEKVVEGHKEDMINEHEKQSKEVLRMSDKIFSQNADQYAKIHSNTKEICANEVKTAQLEAKFYKELYQREKDGK